MVIFMLYLLSSRLIFFFFSFDNREIFTYYNWYIPITFFIKMHDANQQLVYNKSWTLKVVVTTCDILSLSQVPMPLKVLVNYRKKKKNWLIIN